MVKPSWLPLLPSPDELMIECSEHLFREAGLQSSERVINLEGEGTDTCNGGKLQFEVRSRFELQLVPKLVA